jgi:hypothetical protein
LHSGRFAGLLRIALKPKIQLLEPASKKKYDIRNPKEAYMNMRPFRRRMLISYVALYMTFAATAARALFVLQDDPGYGYMVGMLALYLLLLLITPKLIARSLASLHVINALLTAMALVLLLFMGEFDSFALLFIPPCALSVLLLPRQDCGCLDHRDHDSYGGGADCAFPGGRAAQLRHHIPGGHPPGDRSGLPRPTG